MSFSSFLKHYAVTLSQARLQAPHRRPGALAADTTSRLVRRPFQIAFPGTSDSKIFSPRDLSLTPGLTWQTILCKVMNFVSSRSTYLETHSYSMGVSRFVMSLGGALCPGIEEPPPMRFSARSLLFHDLIGMCTALP